ncbi:hypothetical protein H845_215 [Komagataeibacter xylinus E25]|nr:hypothetical protein H845_215 [Komagataeibacter xylinus E25]
MTPILPRGIRNNHPGDLDHVGQSDAHMENGLQYLFPAQIQQMFNGAASS